MHINRIRYQTLVAPSKIEGTVPKYFQIMLYTIVHMAFVFTSVAVFQCDCLYVPSDLCEVNI